MIINHVELMNENLKCATRDVSTFQQGRLVVVIVGGSVKRRSSRGIRGHDTAGIVCTARLRVVILGVRGVRVPALLTVVKLTKLSANINKDRILQERIVHSCKLALFDQIQII